MLTTLQTIVIILMVMVGTMLTRFLPFVFLSDSKGKHPYVLYLGKVLPYAAIGLLVVYCLKNVSLSSYPFGIPEIVSVVVVGALHFWKSNVLLSIGVGTALYMIFVQFIFV